jgi:hypothetical protein
MIFELHFFLVSKVFTHFKVFIRFMICETKYTIFLSVNLYHHEVLSYITRAAYTTVFVYYVSVYV